MKQKVETYILAGGNVACLGGNTMFEAVTFAPTDESMLIFRGGTHNARTDYFFENLTRNSYDVDILGVWSKSGAAGPIKEAPFYLLNEDVVRLSPLLKGTKIGVATPLGVRGRNTGGGLLGSAAGWEIDRFPWDQTPTDPTLRARYSIVGYGGNKFKQLDNNGEPVSGAIMCIFKRYPTSGLVFSAASITFCGSLIDDPILRIIIANVLANFNVTPMTSARSTGHEPTYGI